MTKLSHRYFQIILILISITALFLIFSSFKNSNENSIGSKVYYHEKFYLNKNHEHNNVLYLKTNCISETNKNSKKNFQCLRNFDNTSVYLPYDFIRKKFDIYGKFDQDSNFKIDYANSKIFLPFKDYNSSEEFLWFHNLNVESRDRVKYISLKYGVPISSQWIKTGHLYPVQIAQYGLSHFSKSINTKTETISEKFLLNDRNKFIYNDNINVYLKRFHNGFEFNFPIKSIYKTNYTFDMRYINADIYTISSFDLYFDLMLRDTSLESSSHIVRLIYSFNSSYDPIEEALTDVLNHDKTYTIRYKLNNLKSNEPIKFIRNICLDACKALKIKCDNCLKPLNETMIINNFTSSSGHSFTSQYFKVYQIALKGEGKILNGILSESAPNFQIAKLTANYLIYNQNETTGGWMINITRKFNSKVYIEPGWYSAMAQGHGISLLCRLYSHTKDEKYYISAAKALNLYDVSSENNGVQAKFMGSSNQIWFEEYPTKPFSLFVLNGFIYSILGLNDFLNSCITLSEHKNEIYETKAKNLYLSSLKSLVSLINYYDTGSRTLYDLRHLSDPEINPNVARWEYHTLHISQLSYIVNIIENLNPKRFDHNLMLKYSFVLKKIIKRWINYSKGIWYENSQIK